MKSISRLSGAPDHLDTIAQVEEGSTGVASRVAIPDLVALDVAGGDSAGEIPRFVRLSLEGPFCPIKASIGLVLLS